MTDGGGCPGTNRHGKPCGHPEGWGTDNDSGPCKHHGGAADNRGENNGNFKHGAFSEHFASDFSEREQEAFDALVGALEDQEAATQVLREAAAELFLKYKRSADPRFLREARQLLSEFNVLENADTLELEGDVSLSAEDKELLEDMIDREPQS